jgi:zinc transport system permease protein
LLGIFAHSSLSLGLVALSLIQGLRIDLMAYLFGDILAVTQAELYWIIAGGAAVLIALLVIWRPLLALTVNEDLARVEGVRVDLMRLLFMLLMALVVAVAMKLVGVLLITSLLIIPAAVARRFARSPEQMALLAVVAGGVAVAGGMAVSLQWDTPTGPSIVVVASLLFMVVNLGRISDSAA